MKVAEIISTIEKTAPLAAAAEWDASGVQAASRREDITSVGVMLDPTLASIQAAINGGADFILAHHPLSLKPRFPNEAGEYTDILALIFRNEAWLYSAHTSLDANPEGPVQWLASDLGLVNVRVLEPAAPVHTKGTGSPLPVYGFGCIGDLPAPRPYEEFRRTLRKTLALQAWNACGALPETVRRVACCPGSGSDMAHLARQAGAQVFITGDVKYHAALDAAGRLPRILDVGHFSLEEEMMRRFAAQLGKELSVPVAFYPSCDPLVKE